MSSSQFLTDAATRHAVFVGRFANGHAKKLNKYVIQLQKKIINQLNKADITTFTSNRLKNALADLQALTIEIYKQMGKELTADLLEFGQYEAEFSKNMFEKGIDASFSLPSTDIIEAAIKTNPMNVSPGKDGYTIGTSLRQFEKKAARDIIRTIKDGIVLGKTSKQIKNDIQNITGNIQSQNVEALVRTTTNHVSTQARKVTMKENDDIIEAYQIVATLDSRTTIICAGYDGKVFPLTSSTAPPFHWACRSTTKPVIAKKYDLFGSVGGDRPSIGANGVESVSANTTFDSWLRSQPASFKQEYFSKLPQGYQKYKLFEYGGLKLDRFTDNKNAQYSLSQLKRLQPVAFEKANIKPK